MAISKQDCLLLLTELQDEGINCSDALHKLIKEEQPTI